MTKNKALGRGLAALIGNQTTSAVATTIEESGVQAMLVPVHSLAASPYQPRKVFIDEDLHELSESIKKSGVISPIIVRNVPGIGYQIIAGERRWRASKLASLTEVPIVIKNVSDQDALEIALIENIQRRDLTPIEEADGYQRLINEFTYTQEELSQALGKSRSHIANLLRLLGLSATIKQMVNDGKLSMGHARALVGVDDAESIAYRIIKDSLSVRQTESLIRNLNKSIAAGSDNKIALTNIKAPTESKDNDLFELEQMLSQTLGLKVEVDYTGGRGGKITINFGHLEQLDSVLQRLSGNAI